MLAHYKKLKQRFGVWVIESARSKNAVWVMGVMSFVESIISPIPADVFLMPMAAVRHNKWLWLAFVCTVSSVLGGIFGYLIGFGLFDVVGRPLIDVYNLEEQMSLVGDLFNKNIFSATFVGAFTPIPFKVFTLAAGFFKIQIMPFIIASFLGRGLRYVLVAWLMARFGERIAKTAYRYLSILTLLIVGIIILFIFLV